jgi:hypothetical protein
MTIPKESRLHFFSDRMAEPVTQPDSVHDENLNSGHSLRICAVVFQRLSEGPHSSAGNRWVHGNEPLITAAPDGTLYINALQHVLSLD